MSVRDTDNLTYHKLVYMFNNIRKEDIRRKDVNCEDCSDSFSSAVLNLVSVLSTEKDPFVFILLILY